MSTPVELALEKFFSLSVSRKMCKKILRINDSRQRSLLFGSCRSLSLLNCCLALALQCQRCRLRGEICKKCASIQVCFSNGFVWAERGRKQANLHEEQTRDFLLRSLSLSFHHQVKARSAQSTLRRRSHLLTVVCF